MGLTSSKLEKALGPTFPESEHFFGLANFGNTCYCNSVLQALYFCIPFRKRVLEYYVAKQAEIEANRDDIDATNLLECLAELFWQISSQKKRTGSLPPRKFVQKLRKENELFNSYMHQDAHEFLIYVINEISEILQKEKHQQLEKERKLSKSNEPVPNMRNIKTFVHEVFEGTLTNETKCLTCETVTSRDEIFFDLSVDVEQNTSVTSCLRNFSYTETLGGEDKFFCDTCCSLQEAKKSMKVKKLPHVLALHLKRFKYMEHLQRHKKLHYRVAFPFELKLVNTSDDAADTEREYELFAVVIHVGSGPNHGHYVSMIKSSNHWLLFDDDNVELISEKHIPSVFGYPTDNVGTSDTGYILFYQTRSSDGNEPSTPSTNNSYATATTTTMTPRMMMPNNNSNNVTTKNSSSSVARTSTAAAAEDNNDVINVDDLDTALHSEGEDEDEDEDNGGPSPSSSNSNSNHRRRSGSHHQHQRSHDADMHFDNMEDIHHTTTITTNNYNNNNSNSVGGRGQR